MHPRVQWAIVKAQSMALLAREFDPNEPRDEGGRWTDGGGSDGGAETAGPISDAGEKPNPSRAEAAPRDSAPVEHGSNVDADGEKVWWHGSASGDLRGGTTGLHVGTFRAATEALESRIGIPADGRGWRGANQYQNTLLAGLDTLKKMDPRGFNLTGFNAGSSKAKFPKQDFYPKDYLSAHPAEHPTYSDGSKIPLDVAPNVLPFRITGDMHNSPEEPAADFGDAPKGAGYYYTNEGEDSGSVSATVPNGSFLQHVNVINQAAVPVGDKPDDKPVTGSAIGPGYSNDSTLRNGKIYTSNVYDAARALHEDRPVVLDQPRTLSTLITHLGEIANEMKRQGKDAPNFNLCNVSIAGTNLFCADSLGVPRPQMPQLSTAKTVEFRQHLKDKGYKIEELAERSDHLRATQIELNGAKVARIAGELRTQTWPQEKRLIVSRDNYILDGHHLWAAQIANDAEDGVLGGATTDIARIDIDITTLLDEAKKFGATQEDVNRAALQKYSDDEPRDESGRWTDGGGSGGGDSAPSGGPSLTAEEHTFLVGSRPTPEKLDKWDDQLTARQIELEKEGKAGNDESMQISHMQSALGAYNQESEENLNKGNVGLNAVYHVDDSRLLAAAFTYIDEAKHTAVIQHFGASSHNSGLKALQHTINAFGNKVGQLESQVSTTDGATQAIFEAAGYKPAPGSSGPYIKYVKETPMGALLKPEHAANVLGAAKATALLHGYDPDLITVNMGEHPFTVGARSGYKAAGLAHLDTGKIELFPLQLPGLKSAVYVTSHEVAHQKYQTVLNALEEETKAVMADPATGAGGTDGGMRPDGSLPPALAAKYPIYSRFEKHSGDAWHKRVDDDGITQYSRDYWDAVNAKAGVTVRQAEHETIAEIAKRETETGKIEGKPSWRSYYKDVMKTYDELKAAGKLPTRAPA